MTISKKAIKGRIPLELLSRQYRAGVSQCCDKSTFFKEEVPEIDGFIKSAGHERHQLTLLYRLGRKKPLEQTAS